MSVAQCQVVLLVQFLVHFPDIGAAQPLLIKIP